jgi:hypothetical protein
VRLLLPTGLERQHDHRRARRGHAVLSRTRRATWARATAALALAGVCGLAAPASALPGQSILAFKAWAAHRKLLAGLVPQRDELSGKTAFALSASDHGISWRFFATSDGTTIRRELLSVSGLGKAPGTEPIRQDGQGYGFTFLSSLYGKDVAADYRAARLVAAVKDPTNGRVTHYYRGRRYGYAETGPLALETFATFDADLALARRCAKTPQDCSE